MKAALLMEAGKPLEIAHDVEIADPGPGQVRVRVEFCGVCHSDLSHVDGTFPCEKPILLGHEAAGTVEAVGEGVTRVRPDDRVVLTPNPPCGRCYFCVRGEPGICVNAASLATGRLPDGRTGLSRGGQTVMRGVGLGAFAEYALTPETGAVCVPDEVPLDVACVIGCAVQTGVGAVLNTARVEEGASVLVMGLGGIGLSIVQGARLAAAGRIIVSDPVETRREAARALGATDLVDPTQEDLATRVRELTEIGVDYAFDAVGRAALVEAGLAVTRNGGTTVCVGAVPIGQEVRIPMPVGFMLAEKKLVGCTLGSCNALLEIPRLVRLWQTGRLDLEALISFRRPLEEINQAMDDLARSRGVRTVLAI